MELPNGLKGHRAKIEEICSWCSDWIDQDAFDAKERDALWGAGHKTLEGMGSSDFMLNLVNPYGHLLLMLRERGLIEAEKRADGRLWYKTTPTGQRS